MRRRWRQPPKQSLSCELRVAISLVRLQGEPALAGVAEVYGKFSEGFDTADTCVPPGDTGVVLILRKERWERKQAAGADPMEGAGTATPSAGTIAEHGNCAARQRRLKGDALMQRSHTVRRTRTRKQRGGR